MKRLRIPAWLFLVAACSEADEPPVEPNPSLVGVVVPTTTQSPPRPDAPVDAAISDRVREAILADGKLSLDARTVQVSTRDGVVTLSGSVRTRENLERMTVVVGAVGSVVRVDNRLAVLAQPTSEAQVMETAVERTISDRVRLAFQNDSKVAPESGSIDVTTKEGVVTLKGTVSSALVRDRAGVAANAVGSVARVDNQLQVSPG